MNAIDHDHLLEEISVNPDFLRKAKAVLADVRSKHPELMVIEVYRSPEKQRMLYCQGRMTKQLKAEGYRDKEIAKARAAGYVNSKKQVTQTPITRFHGRGLAMDCAWLVGGKLTWEVPQAWWEMVGHAARTHELVWGGDWKIRDRPHIQLGE